MNNKYTKWYYEIILNAQLQSRKKLSKSNMNYEYYEIHHILPRIMFPEYSNLTINKCNAVLLTPKEHFLVHLLLTKMTKGYNQIQMCWAFNMMCLTRKNIRNRASVFYVKNKQNLIKTTEQRLRTSGPNNGFYGKTHTDEFKQYMSSIKRGKQLSDDHKMKLRLNAARPNLGKSLSDEVRKKLSDCAKERYSDKNNHPSFGKKMSDVTKEKIGNKNKGHKHTDEFKGQASIRVTGKGNPMYGSKFLWINDGVKNKRHDPQLPIPDNFVKGKIQKTLSRRSSIDKLK